MHPMGGFLWVRVFSTIIFQCVFFAKVVVKVKNAYNIYLKK